MRQQPLVLFCYQRRQHAGKRMERERERERVCSKVTVNKTNQRRERKRERERERSQNKTILMLLLFGDKSTCFARAKFVGKCEEESFARLNTIGNYNVATRHNTRAWMRMNFGTFIFFSLLFAFFPFFIFKKKYHLFKIWWSFNGNEEKQRKIQTRPQVLQELLGTENIFEKITKTKQRNKKKEEEEEKKRMKEEKSKEKT